MRIENPNQVALLVAAGSTSMSLLGLWLCSVFLGFELSLWVWLVAMLVLFGVSFAIGWWATEKFVHGKIKLIYRSIHNPTLSEQKMSAASRSRDALAEVQKEVEEWASGKQSEIATLKEQAQFRRDFIGNLAHELKTPIFNIQGYLLTLLEGGLEDAKINSDYLKRADKNLERLIDMVEDLDSISKMEAGREVLKLEKFNIVNLVEEVYSLFDLRAREKEIELTFNKKYDRPIWVNADKSKVLQVLSNLVVNAVNYGNHEGYCEVRFFDMSQNILIEVADNGIGITEEDLPRLFERFYRVDKSRSRHQGGTGLGLAIVKHIIESHGQSISARSVPDKGTTFSFTLEKAK